MLKTVHPVQIQELQALPRPSRGHLGSFSMSVRQYGLKFYALTLCVAVRILGKVGRKQEPPSVPDCFLKTQE